MQGHGHKLGYTYYRCWPTNNNRGRPDKHAGHPRTVYVREEAITAVVDRAFSQFLFHPQRRVLLSRDVDQAGQRAHAERAEQRSRLQRRTADLARRQENLLRQAEDADPNDPFVQGLRTRYNDLQTERQVVLDEIAALDDQDRAEPRRASETELNVLDALPHLTLNFDRAPDALQQRLFELTKLRVEVHYQTQEATLMITLPREELAVVSTTATALRHSDEPEIKLPSSAKLQVEASVNAVGAPGESRTHTGRVLNPLPLPVGLRGRARGETLRDRVGAGLQGSCRRSRARSVTDAYRCSCWLWCTSSWDERCVATPLTLC